MGSLMFIVSTTNAPKTDSLLFPKININNLEIGTHTLNFEVTFRPKSPLNGHIRCFSTQGPSSYTNPQSDGEKDPQELVEDLRIPENWLKPSKALEESEWLRVTLHNWLDDEYCPEATNVEISKVAAHSYYKSLLEKQTDLGEILLKMARELERISFRESFHGAFSSANAAVDLIIQRIEQD